jgi:outer membrane protein
MTKFVQRSAITAVMAFAMFTQSAQAQKIAIVDINAVVSAMPEYQSASTKIDGLTKAYTDSLQNMRTKYQATSDGYAKLGETASADMKKKEQDDLAAQQDAFGKFQEAKFGQEGELAQMKQNLMKPITDKLQNTLETFAKKKHYTMIIPKTATVFADPSVDATTEFQDFLKAQ